MDFTSTIQCLKATTWRALFFGVQLEAMNMRLPERDLMLAVLKGCLAELSQNLHNPNKLFKADRAWFFKTIAMICIPSSPVMRRARLERAWDS